MNLSPAQIAVLKADLPNHPEIAAAIQTADDGTIAAFYNAVDGVATDNFVWKTDVAVEEVQNVIQWDRLTPNQQIPLDTATVQVQTAWANRAIHCQGKQNNLYNLLNTRSGRILCSRPNIRAAFQDALSNVPSASDGSGQSAGVLAVASLFKRQATRIERLFSGVGLIATPADLVFIGPVSAADCGAAR